LCFSALEDETGIGERDYYAADFSGSITSTVVHQQFLLIEGRLQNQDNVISVKAERVAGVGDYAVRQTTSHDFH